jgi:murein DD-endopeptidase MepM/ murein hydrolase activator NlpD
MTYNWRLPFPKVADPFGSHSPQRKAMGLGPHRGCDYNGFKAGTPLKAVGDGKVTLNKWSDVLGWVVEIQVGKWFFIYCHMDKQSPLKVGTAVKSGQSVGGAGTSGSASSGVHLHFTLSLTSGGGISGKVYDPHTFLVKMIAAEKIAPAPADATTVTPASVKHCATCACKE